MIRTLACSLLLAFVGGCTITTRNGGHPESPERIAAGSEHRSESRPRRPPRPSRPDRPDVPKTKPEPRPPVSKPEPEPEPEARPPVSKPEPKPEPRPPVSKPEPAPPVSKPGPKPEPKTPPPVTKPDPKPPVTKPDPKPPVTKPEPKETGIRGFVFGAPPDLKPGLPDAFWIYQDDKGWHLRTTTDDTKVFHKFSGRIWVTEGKFTEVKASATERQQDSLKSTDQSITFTFDTLGVMDGVDWLLTGNKCIHFDLRYDGEPHIKVIRVGAKKVVPPSNVFVVCGR